MGALDIRETLCDVLGRSLLDVAAVGSVADAFFHDSERISSQVVLRHTCEHIFRIRMFRPLDSDASRLLTAAHSDVAELWVSYARSEAVHDRYFVRDLRAHGIEFAELARLEPFPSTLALGRYIREAMRSFGALPVVLYSFWAEMNSEYGTSPVVRRTAELFGDETTKGALAHRHLDVGQDHSMLICEVLAVLLRSKEQIAVAADVLEGISQLIGEYFLDLECWEASLGGTTPEVSPRESVAKYHACYRQPAVA